MQSSAVRSLGFVRQVEIVLYRLKLVTEPSTSFLITFRLDTILHFVFCLIRFCCAFDLCSQMTLPCQRAGSFFILGCFSKRNPKYSFFVMVLPEIYHVDLPSHTTDPVSGRTNSTEHAHRMQSCIAAVLIDLYSVV